MSKKPGNIGPATRQPLSHSPQDMPDRGGSKKPAFEGSATMQKLNPGKAHPFAFEGAKPSMGKVESVGTQANLSRTPADVYGERSATSPLGGFRAGGKKGKKG